MCTNNKFLIFELTKYGDLQRAQIFISASSGKVKSALKNYTFRQADESLSHKKYLGRSFARRRREKFSTHRDLGEYNMQLCVMGRNGNLSSVPSKSRLAESD